MSEVKHKNSKIVTIHQAGSFLARAQGSKEAREYFANARLGVGSAFESENSTKIMSGLTFKEQRLLMPELLEVDSQDKDFLKKTAEYFQEIYTKVPETGRDLEIGLELDNNAEVSDKNRPINTADFIRWRHALKHPEVAHSKSEADSNSLKRYYIFDKYAIESEKNHTLQEQDAAVALYLTIREDKKKTDMMLTLLGVDVRTFSGATKEDSKLATLREFANKEPKKFIDTASGDDFETRYWLEQMISTGQLKRINQRVIEPTNNTLIGSSTEEAMFWLKDDENTDMVRHLKAMVQEALAKPVKASATRTRNLKGEVLGDAKV